LKTTVFTSKISKKSYEIRKLNFGEVSKIMDASQAVGMKTFVPMPSIWKQRLLTIQQAVVKPELTEEQIAAMNPNEGLELFIAVQRNNTIPLSESPESSSTTREQKRHPKD